MTQAEFLDKLYAPVRDELDATRALLESAWADVVSLAGATDDSTPRRVGKLLRPAVCLLMARTLGFAPVQGVERMAAALELLHVAALVHDDVVDRSMVRRGVASLNAVRDERTAVLAGDCLVAESMILMTEYNSVPLVREVIAAVRDMAATELTHVGATWRDLDPSGCLELARGKTGALFALAAATPAYCTGDSRAVQCVAYGEALGIVFQLADDILDLVQTEAEMGKPVCADVVEGKPTVPLRILHESLSGEDCARLQALQGEPLRPTDRDWLRAMLEQTGALAQTRRIAEEHVRMARTALDTLPPCGARDSLEAMITFALERQT